MAKTDTVVPHRDTDEVLAHEINVAKATAWKPEPGDRFTGLLYDVRGVPTKYKGDHIRDGKYPKLTYQVVKDGNLTDDFVAVHVFHHIAYESLTELKPVLTDMHTWMYVDKKLKNEQPDPERPQYYHHTIVVKGDGADLGSEAPSDWFGDGIPY